MMLYEKLKHYPIKDIYPMHMPGHKRNPDFSNSDFPFDLDITEIYGFDDLHNPQGILKDTAKLAADLYGSREVFLLVNGTTVGVLAAIGAHTERGDKILAVDNCHVSTPNAAELFGLDVVYITPDIDENTDVPCSITPQAIETALENDPDIKLVIITSPSYEGVVSDISSISKVAHKHGIPLIVDAAHGAHLGFSNGFPENPTKLGADVIIVSLHKTLPALTQCSLLHICSERADVNRVRHLLSMLQTTSPSYVLMASIDYCLNLLNDKKEVLFREYEKNLNTFATSIENLKKLKVLHHGNDPLHQCFFDFDMGKIVVVTQGTKLSGAELANVLRSEYKIEIERVCDHYIIAMTSICDTKEGFARLAVALNEIDSLQA